MEVEVDVDVNVEYRAELEQQRTFRVTAQLRYAVLVTV